MKSIEQFFLKVRAVVTPPFLPPLSYSLPAFECRGCSALRDFNCHIETICICCHMVPQTANEKLVEFLPNQSAQTWPGCRPADRGVSPAWASWLKCLSLLPQLLFEKHDGPLLVLQMIFRLLSAECWINPLALPWHDRDSHNITQWLCRKKSVIQ